MAPTNSRSQEHSNAPSLPDPLLIVQQVKQRITIAATALQAAQSGTEAPNPENKPKPKRIQRKRTKGWRMPEGAIYVGRPTDFGNPHSLIGSTPEIATKLFEEHLLSEPGLLELAIKKLRGKDLACFCPLNQACHADILLRYVNRGRK
ncbi:DUF4326 domain-containing protein [Synechococcus sp. UW140]|uniref:DUF4326 domain-containing protein n=1 Tax=Synechococcus sp. UW140 TaxID=368503 RepID=UPI003137B7C5